MVSRNTLAVPLAVLCCVAPSFSQDLQVPEFVRLPGEYTTKDESAAQRIVELEQVSQCVADEPALHARGSELVRQESAIKGESADIDLLGERLKESDAALRVERTAFDGLVSALDVTDQSLQEMASSLERLGADKSTREMVVQYNAAVDAYNVEVRKRNAQLAEVRRAQAAFKVKVAAHNEKVRDQHRRIDDFNSRATSLRTQAEAFFHEVRAFDSDCLQPGER